MDRHRQTPEQVEALRQLHEGAVKEGSNCLDRPEDWVDYEKPPSNANARKMCAGCPVFDLCAKYVEVAQPKFGVWAGEKRGDELL